MKKIFSSPNLSHCDMVRVCLEQNDIPCTIKNEHTSRMAGGGAGVITGAALGYAWPEVWVLNDEYMQSAHDCLQQSGLSFLDDPKPK